MGISFNFSLYEMEHSTVNIIGMAFVHYNKLSFLFFIFFF